MPSRPEPERTSGFETPDLISWLHDAANLIRNIDLCTHLLASPDLDPLTRRRAHQSALRTIAVLKDMFPSLRRPLQRRKARQAVCEIHEAIASSVEVLQQRAQLAKVTIETVPAAELLFVSGDRGAYQRLIYNLILNALQASSRGGRVTVMASSVEGRVVLVIADTGTGVPRSVRRRLFKEPVSTKRQGSGRGLMHAAATVATLRGTIAIDSRFGKGTRVILTFPAARTPAGAKRGRERHPS